jgi:hypothetical protein
MTTTEPVSKGPTAYARAENASRRVLLIVCLGVLAWGVGSVLSVNLRELLEAALDEAVDTGGKAIIEHWAFQRVWMLLVLAPLSWLAGRFIGGPSALFVLPATVSGEALSFAVEFIKEGSPFHSWEDVAGWAVSLVIALVPCFAAFISGAKAFDRAQAQSLVDAAGRKAEYDAFVAKTTEPAPPSSEPPKP